MSDRMRFSLALAAAWGFVAAGIAATAALVAADLTEQERALIGPMLRDHAASAVLIAALLVFPLAVIVRTLFRRYVIAPAQLDEDARIMVSGRDLSWIDRAAEIADGPVDAPEVVGLGHVRHGKSPHGGRIRGACKQQRFARCAVPAAAPHHLYVALERVRVVEQTDEPNVGFVDPHAKSRRRGDAADAAGNEVVLHTRALAGLEARVVVLHAEAVSAQRAGNPLA